ncbi:MAG: hypothetical protein EBY09_05650 [Verrucomicrobia bacterium]|nr:hypothetical protein [Verrucomicrobiota bacterium]
MTTRIKDAFGPAGWHLERGILEKDFVCQVRDFTHMKDFLTVWVPLVVVDEGTGGVVVYEGSHQDGNVQHVAEGSWEAKAIGDLDKYPQLHVHMNPGDILTFPSELLHASAPQTSSRIRYSIDFRVFRDPADSTKSFFKAKTQEIVRVD